jgi:hypothetical protein
MAPAAERGLRVVYLASQQGVNRALDDGWMDGWIPKLTDDVRKKSSVLAHSTQMQIESSFGPILAMCVSICL